jgi:hypothetical protein
VVGTDGPPLTVGGELNKLRITYLGPRHAGVHWRADDVQRNRQGEEIAKGGKTNALALSSCKSA